MALRVPGTSPGQDDQEQEGAPGGATPLDWAGYVAGAALRRRRLVAGIFLAGTAASLVFYLLRSPTYHAETRIFAQRQQVLSNAARTGGIDDQPTRAAWDLVHRRENLVALVKQSNMEPEPAAAGPGKKGFLAMLRPGKAPVEEEDPLNPLVARLDRSLMVIVGENTITISIDWPDPDQAYRLVENALQNFLEARHVQEITAIDEVIALLQGRAAALRAQLERVSEEVRRELLKYGDGVHPAVPQEPPTEELVRLKSMVDAKERAIGDVEEFRRRRVADLHAQYDAKRNVLSDVHPDIVNLRHDIQALSRESPQVLKLREEERGLREEYQMRLQEARRQAAAPGGRLGSFLLVDQSERVRDARFQYQQMVERVNAAQLDLDAARAAFKYRYNVIWPTQVPRSPVGPRFSKIVGAGLVASLLLALFVAFALDWRSGLVLQRWQVERSLDLPVLAELDGTGS